MVKRFSLYIVKIKKIRKRARARLKKRAFKKNQKFTKALRRI